MSYDPNAKGLFTVYDMRKKGYRSIRVRNVETIKLDGKTYQVVR